MSACISSRGEYSSHELDDLHTCIWCGVLDEDALRSELAEARASASLTPTTPRRRAVTDLRRPLSGSRAVLASLVWAEVKSSGLRQTEVAANAGITEKHLSQIMRGHITGSLDVIDAVLAVCGRELVLSTRIRFEGPSGG